MSGGRDGDPMLLESPFLDEAMIERPEEAFEDRFDYQKAPGLGEVSFPSGQKLTVTTGPELPGEEFFTPYPIKNPLLDVVGSKGSAKLSKHFTAAEFARSGSARFPKARIDPALVECVERIRVFLKLPVTILDGYHSYKYLADLAKRQKLDKVPLSPHLNGQGAKFKAGSVSGIELAKAVVFCSEKDTSISVGVSSAAVYVKQPSPEVTSYITHGETRERAIATVRKYHELFHSDAAMLAATRADFHGIRLFVHSAIHGHQIRDENILADVAFHKSTYVVQQRAKHKVSGRFDKSKEIDRKLRAEILGKAVRPALGEVVAPAAHSGGVPTTPKGERAEAPAQPDRPPVDLTGRYETIHQDQSEELGKTMCINQVGLHAEIVISPVNAPAAPPRTERYANRYYGDFEKDGSLKVFSRNAAQDKFRFVPRGQNINLEWSSGRESYKRVSDAPVLFEQPVSTFDPSDRPLLQAYEWKPLLRKQIEFLRLFFGDKDKIGRQLHAFYDAKGDLQRWKEFYQGQAVKEFGKMARKWEADSTRGFHVSDRPLALFYIRHFMTLTVWRPSGSYPYLPALDWAQRAVSIVEYQCKHHPNRTGTSDAGALVDDLVEVLGLKREKASDGHLHKYKVTIKLTGGAILVGGFKGTLTVEKSDGRKWPQGKETFSVWFASVGAGVKWKKGKGAKQVGPIKVGETYVGNAVSNFYWLPNDFPGTAKVALGEASAAAGAKVGATGGFMHISGRGGLPVLQVIFADVDVGVAGKSVGGGAEIIAGIGRIRDKKFKDVQYPASSDKTDYAVRYKLSKEAHFGYNSAFLTPQARQALRVMGAHELVALMSPESTLNIDAHTDAEGKPERNQELSKLRAANTQRALEDILGGMLQCTVKTTGHGEKEAAGETVRSQDRRRVDLRLNGRLVLRLRA